MHIRTILRWTAGSSLALLGVAALFYVRDIRGAYARIQDRSSIIHSPYGDIEFTQGGTGPPVAGAAFDNTAALPNERIVAIQAPTLVVHAKDDGLQLFHNAEFAATTIPGARLLSYNRGGHLLIVTEQASIRDAVRHHINSGLTSVGQAVTRR